MKTLRAWLFLLGFVGVVEFALLASSSAADFSAIWDGGNGNWGDSIHWSTNPTYPNNTGDVTYDATINAGTVTLDQDITIHSFFFNGGILNGDFALNLNEGFNWTAGDIGNSTISLTKGSTSTISATPYGTFQGTLNNSGTVNQTGYFDLYQINTGDSAIVNNLAGATWILQGAAGINLPVPFGYQGSGGTFNNAGNLIVTPTENSTGFRTAVNNSGNITIQTPSVGAGTFFIDHGTANGSFNVAAQAALQFTSYTLTTGATISGAGVTQFSELLTIAGDATVSTDLVNGNSVFVSPTLLVEKGATLTLNGTFTQAAAIFPPVTRLAGGTITNAHPLNFQAGSLTGSGTINGDVISNATISPGASAGTLAINGNVSLLDSSKLVMEIGGLTQGTQYDYLAVEGMTALDGTLELHMLNGFQLQLDPSQTFTLLTSKDVLSGAFDNVADGARLTTADGRASFQVNYGAGSPYGANNLVLSDPQVVPEPASLVLFAVGVTVLGVVRFRKR